ncbi:MAG: hypothetical protein QOJ50_1865 [Cryptosporangiaceae bacterium]|nr:hypothetical protein [Cryptosporangiaceae bacterium]
MTILVVPYNPEWPARFAEEAALLERELSPWLATELQHIGSTSIPGLPAKPILDMMVGVTSLDAAAGAIPVLGGLGYTHAPHREDALWFRKAAEAAESAEFLGRTHNLHLTEAGSPLWRERLAFRDALRADPALRDEYADLKLRLATEHEDGRAYTADKRPFVAGVLAAAGITL